MRMQQFVECYYAGKQCFEKKPLQIWEGLSHPLYWANKNRHQNTYHNETEATKYRCDVNSRPTAVFNNGYFTYFL